MKEQRKILFISQEEEKLRAETGLMEEGLRLTLTALTTG